MSATVYAYGFQIPHTSGLIISGFLEYSHELNVRFLDILWHILILKIIKQIML
jgi:hypothetical protein